MSEQILLAALIWISDAADGDTDMEPEPVEDGDIDCCEAGDDTGTRYWKWDYPIGCKGWSSGPGDPDDTEWAPAPNFLRRDGRWRGGSVYA